MQKKRSIENVRAHLRFALSLCDDDDQKRHIRESLQILEGLRDRCD